MAKSVVNASSFWESAPFWGFASLAATLVCTVLGVRMKDLTLLYVLAWFCATPCIYIVTKKVNAHRTKVRMLLMFVVALVLYETNKYTSAAETTPLDPDKAYSQMMEFVNSGDEQRDLLKQFPLGYVTFETNAVTGAVTPLDSRRGLEAYEFDFTKVKILENTENDISIRLPDVLENGNVIMGAPIFRSNKLQALAYGGGGMVGNDPHNLLMYDARVLRYSDNGDKIFWVFGFRHARLN